MQLVIAEKPSVSQSIAKILGATSRKDGYTEVNDILLVDALGIWWSLPPPTATMKSTQNGG